MQMTSVGWGYLCDRSKVERKKILQSYAEKYIEPMFEAYPEIKGKVYLALRKDGFFADSVPVLNILVPADLFQRYGDYELRFFTAHELMHMVQYANRDRMAEWNAPEIEKQATFMAFGRGYAYDYVKSFPEYCNREKCDMNDKFSYFKCSNIFKRPCRKYSDDELKAISGALERTAKKYTITEFPDYIKVIEEALKDL